MNECVIFYGRNINKAFLENKDFKILCPNLINLTYK